MNLESKLEALLFWKGEPMAKKKIETALGCSFDELEGALKSLEAALVGRGIRLMRIDDEVELRTAPETSDMITKLTKEELVRDLGKAGLETLSIILYKSPIKRSEIDYIRGVNSSFIVRNLLVRGLVERVTEKEGGGRGYSYKPTIDLLAHLGISKIEELPDFAKVKAEMETFANETQEADAVPAAEPAQPTETP
jgi:segregation and condensation protein B